MENKISKYLLNLKCYFSHFQKRLKKSETVWAFVILSLPDDTKSKMISFPLQEIAKNTDDDTLAENLFQKY